MTAEDVANVADIINHSTRSQNNPMPLHNIDIYYCCTCTCTIYSQLTLHRKNDLAAALH